MENYNVINRPHHSFTQIPNCVITSSSISGTAKAVYGYLLSVPNNWQFYTSQIASNFKESLNTIRKALAELESHGLIFRHQIRKDGKFHSTIWHIYFDFSTQNVRKMELLAATQNTVRGNTADDKTAYDDLDSNNTLESSLRKREDSLREDERKNFLDFCAEFKNRIKGLEKFKISGDRYSISSKNLLLKNGKILKKSEAEAIFLTFFKNKEEFFRMFEDHEEVCNA